MAFYIGTGSWADPEYKKLLVAPGVPAKERLKAYAAWFDHVEVNSSYHHIPSAKQVAGWIEQTPAGFTFDLKLHEFFCQDPQRSASPSQAIESGASPKFRLINPHISIIRRETPWLSLHSAAPSQVRSPRVLRNDRQAIRLNLESGSTRHRSHSA